MLNQGCFVAEVCPWYLKKYCVARAFCHCVGDAEEQPFSGQNKGHIRCSRKQHMDIVLPNFGDFQVFLAGIDDERYKAIIVIGSVFFRRSRFRWGSSLILFELPNTIIGNWVSSNA